MTLCYHKLGIIMEMKNKNRETHNITGDYLKNI